MSHPQFQAKPIRQAFQMIFEDVAIAGVTAATIAQQQHSPSVGVSEAAMGFPPIGDALASEATGVVAEAQIQVSEVSLDVVEAMRINDSVCGTGKIVIQGLLGMSRIEPTDAKQKPQEFLVFGVQANNGIGRIHEFGAVVGDDLELPIAASMLAQRQCFTSFATAEAVSLQQLNDHRDTDTKAQP